MLRAPRSAAASSVAVLRRPHQKKPQGRLSTCKSNCGDDCFPWQFKFSHGGSGRAQSWRRLIWQAYPTAFLRPGTTIHVRFIYQSHGSVMGIFRGEVLFNFRGGTMPPKIPSLVVGKHHNIHNYFLGIWLSTK